MDDLLARLARFERNFFPRYDKTYRRLVDEGRQQRHRNRRVALDAVFEARRLRAAATQRFASPL